jgi:hypothetical protein
MSSTVSAKAGPLERLKVRSRCGCSRWASQIRCTERRLMPVACAIARPVQWVGCPRGSEQVSARTFATLTVGIGSLPGGPVLSCSRMIRARWMCFWGRCRSAAIAASRARSPASTTTQHPGPSAQRGMPQSERELSVCVSALARFGVASPRGDGNPGAPWPAGETGMGAATARRSAAVEAWAPPTNRRPLPQCRCAPSPPPPPGSADPGRSSRPRGSCRPADSAPPRFVRRCRPRPRSRPTAARARHS